MPPPSERRVFVGGTRDANEGDFHDYFSQFGDLEEIAVFRTTTGRPRGCGFVGFSTKEAVDLVLRNDYHTLNNGLRVNTRPYNRPGKGSGPPPRPSPPRSPRPPLPATPPLTPSVQELSSREEDPWPASDEPLASLSGRFSLLELRRRNASENASNQPTPETSASEATSSSNPLRLGERVVYIGDETWEHGVVRWIGELPERENPSSQEVNAGLELDRPVGIGTGTFDDRQLFTTPMNHAIFVPLAGLLREDDFLGLSPCDEPKDVANPVNTDSHAQNNNVDTLECQVCFERQINSAFYKCGHSSFCYECALACKNKEPGLCPICRTPIDDVLKLYK